MSLRTFHDQWHRIASLRVGLRQGVLIRLHSYNDEPWYVLYEAGHGGYFRLRPEFHDMVTGMTPDRTLDETWRAAINQNPDTAPGQQEFFELISALYAANLLYVEGGVDEMRLVDRAHRKKAKKLPARISEFLFFRIPLWDPEPFLRRNQRAISIVYSPLGIVFVACVVLWGAIEFFLAGDRIWVQAQTILQPANLPILYLAIFATHCLHEISHAALCKYFGGHVRTMGVMLLLFTPLPYADVSAAWAFRDRWQRAFVGAAGIYADIFTCAVATIVWAWTAPGFVNEMAYNLMFVTAVYTLVFNINPLMRFDGYYILADLIDQPNLHQESRNAFQTLWRGVFLREHLTDDGLVTARRRGLLVSFFLSSAIYRTIIMVGIILFVADQYFGVGLIVGFALAYTALVQPLQNALTPMRSPLFMARHARKIRLSGFAVVALFGAFLFLPLPYSRQLDGVIEAARDTAIHTRSGGQVSAVHVAPGSAVAEGQVLIALHNRELELELEAVEAQMQRVRAQASEAIIRGSVELEALRERMAMLISMRAHLENQLAALVIRAPHDGIWVGDDPAQRLGVWVGRGYRFGNVVDEQSHVFLGVIRQESAHGLGSIAAPSLSVRIEGMRGVLHKTADVTIVPYSQRDLPSAVLGAQGRGEMAVSARDPEGRESVEQFFLLKASIDGANAPQMRGNVYTGRTAWVQIELPPRPIGARAAVAVQQFFQRRYQI